MATFFSVFFSFFAAIETNAKQFICQFWGSSKSSFKLRAYKIVLNICFFFFFLMINHLIAGKKIIVESIIVYTK